MQSNPSRPIPFLEKEGMNPSFPPAKREGRWTFTAAGLLLWMPFIVFAVIAGEDRLVRFFPDDAFYYLQPAVNFAANGLASFDGVHPTNGFHPLNFLLIAGLALLVPKPLLLGATFILHSGLLVAAVMLMTSSYLSRLSIPLRILAAAIAMLPVFTLFILLCMGMEASLVVFCTVLLIAAWDRARESAFGSLAANLLLGLAIALFVMARLDLSLVLLFFFSYSVALLCFVNDANSRQIRLAAFSAIWLVPLFSMICFALVNYFRMGNPLPISMAVKLWILLQAQTAGPLDGSGWGSATRYSLAGWGFVLLPLAASALYFAFLGHSRKAKESIGSSMFLLNLGNLVYYAYLTLAGNRVFRWYFAFPAACALANWIWFAMLAGHRLTWRFTGRPIRHIAQLAVIFCMVMNLLVLNWAGNRAESVSYHLKKVAEMLNRYVGTAGVTATSDSGIVAFYAGGRVINLDGLSNDFEYLRDVLQTGHYAAYFRGEGVTHFLVRDSLLLNPGPVASGRYQKAYTTLDPQLVLHSEDELFRYAIPGHFQLFCFRLNS